MAYSFGHNETVQLGGSALWVHATRAQAPRGHESITVAQRLVALVNQQNLRAGLCRAHRRNKARQSRADNQNSTR
jgi:hypothetical protein